MTYTWETLVKFNGSNPLSSEEMEETKESVERDAQHLMRLLRLAGWKCTEE